MGQSKRSGSGCLRPWLHARPEMTIEIKTPDQLRKMRAAGLVVAEGLRRMQEATVPGVTTAEIAPSGVRCSRRREQSRTSSGTELSMAFPSLGVSCIFCQR